MTPHEWFIEHRVAYATRTLDQDEVRSFGAHLADCEECRRELARIEEDLRWLPMGARPVAASAGFPQRRRQRVLLP